MVILTLFKSMSLLSDFTFAFMFASIVRLTATNIFIKLYLPFLIFLLTGLICLIHAEGNMKKHQTKLFQQSVNYFLNKIEGRVGESIKVILWTIPTRGK